MSSWSQAVLGDVAQVFNGKTPSKAEQREEGHPVLKIRDVSEFGRFRDSFNSFVDQEFAARFPDKKIQPGDTLILNAAHNADYVGSKTYRAEAPTFGALATGEWLIVRASKELSAEYAHHWVTSKETRLKIRELVNGIHLYPKDVSRLKIPLPPLPEQRRIAAILDKADALRIQRREALAQLDRLAQAIFVEMFGDPDEHIRQGRTKALSEVVAPGKIVTYGIVQAGPEIPDGVPYIKTGDIKNGRILEEQLSRTSREIASAYSRSEVSAGDIVMSIRATVGTTALVPQSLDGANLTQGTARISPGDSVRASYMLCYLRTEAVQRWIQSKVKGATFREITLGSLRDLPVFTPSLPLQDEFTARIAAAGFLEAQNATSLKSLEDLFQALQHRAFRGEL